MCDCPDCPERVGPWLPSREPSAVDHEAVERSIKLMEGYGCELPIIHRAYIDLARQLAEAKATIALLRGDEEV